MSSDSFIEIITILKVMGSGWSLSNKVNSKLYICIMWMYAVIDDVKQQLLIS